MLSMDIGTDTTIWYCSLMLTENQTRIPKMAEMIAIWTRFCFTLVVLRVGFFRAEDAA